MPEQSPAFRLIEHVYSSLVATECLFAPDEIANSGAQPLATMGPGCLVLSGVINEKPGTQSLQKKGTEFYRLITTLDETMGSPVEYRFRPWTSTEALEVVSDSLFFQALAKIALARNFPPQPVKTPIS